MGLRLRRVSPDPLAWSSHTVTVSDLDAAVPPVAADQDWRVWNPYVGDGLLPWRHDCQCGFKELLFTS